MHIRRHASRITANVEISPFFQPSINFSTLLTQPVLHVDFSIGITRESQINTIKHPFLEPSLPLGLIKKVGSKMRIPEQQPATSLAPLQFSFLHEGSKRRHARARPHHNDRCITIE